MNTQKPEQTEPRYAEVVQHANVKSSLAYVARKTGLGFQEATRLLELALQRGDLPSNDYAGRRLDCYVEDRENALKQELKRLHARVQELEQAEQAHRDAAFEAVRKRLCKLTRYSFIQSEFVGVRRITDQCGNWIYFDSAHDLFDPVAVDAAMLAAAPQPNT